MNVRVQNDVVAKFVQDGRQLIDGRWIGSHSGETFPVLNPATGETLALVPRSGRSETKLAIESAQTALRTWRAQTAGFRGDILLKMAALIRESQDELALLMTLEQGKPFAEALREIDQTIAFFRWYGEESRRLYGEIIPPDRSGRRLSVVRQPIGVVGAITPWNFPSSMVARKIAPALAAGCTVVLKPAEDTPLSALALGELAVQAGVPSGVFNIVTGTPSEIGAELTGNSTVRKITFTGSTPVGKLLAEQSASTVKRLSLELGGNAPFIVFDDADLDAAVDGALQSRFRNAGQTCVAANRIYVQRGIHDAFVSALSKRVGAFTVGAGTDPEVTIGPLINAAAAAKVHRMLEDALEHGARVVGDESSAAVGETFVQPRLITDVSESMLVARDEIFGPVAAVLPFDDEDEVVERANGTPYGLAAYFYTSDRGRQVRVSEALEFGMVGINECLVAYEGAPFGGVKESGTGREGSHHGLEDYTEIKYICEGGLG